MANNIYKPEMMKIVSVTEETPDVKTFRLVFQNSKQQEFAFRAGQFGEYSVFGEGEATFCIASSPTHKDYIECSIKKLGKVTAALHDLGEGDTIGFRGPYGNWFPLEYLTGKNLLFVGGGIGLAPLRSLIWNCLDCRNQFERIIIIYGARTVTDLVYKQELQEWENRADVEIVSTVDPGGETPEWKGKIGLVPHVLGETNPPLDNTVAITCGPPIMIKFTIAKLLELGFSPDDIITTLEMKMKCGLGKCGRCNIGTKYVCKDGPVFRFSEIKQLPDEF